MLHRNLIYFEIYLNFPLFQFQNNIHTNGFFFTDGFNNIIRRLKRFRLHSAAANAIHPETFKNA